MGVVVIGGGLDMVCGMWRKWIAGGWVAVVTMVGWVDGWGGRECAGAGREVVVRNPGELRAALGELREGTVLRIGPGEYPGGNWVQGVKGLTVEALEARNPPRFVGGSVGWHFSRCEGLTVRRLRLSGQRGNGINLDDGGERERPVAGILLEGLEISEVGPRGNHDGIKGSGLRGVTIRDCVITGWGGEGIDLVGCHQVLIAGCRLVGKAGFGAATGVQVKGGSSEVTVERCRFTNAGQRPINVGGSTGLAYFRPAGAKQEASRVVVRNNVIEGGLCAVAFVGAAGVECAGNTILFPEKWVFRMLQETQLEGFTPCRDVRVRDNRIVFRRAQVQVEVNVGPGTEPGTMRFEGNQWFAEDRPGASRPRLPVTETGGVYGVDPRRGGAGDAAPKGEPQR